MLKVGSLSLFLRTYWQLAAGSADCPLDADVIIWGGTVCGATAAAAVVETDPSLSVLWLVNGSRLGGMTSGGLGGRDGGTNILGGLAAQLFQPLGQNFEPGVAEHVLEDFLSNFSNKGNVTLRTNTGWLSTVETQGERPRHITAVTTLGGVRACGRVFLDCSYEGDLLRLSGTDFAVGRESRSEFYEDMAGADGPDFAAHAEKPSFFATEVSPWVDDSNTTLLPTILGVHSQAAGEADDWVQAYCFRMCLSNNRSNAIAIDAPDGYDRQHLELLRREIKEATNRQIKLGLRSIFDVRQLPNSKIDLNSGQWSTQAGNGTRHFPFSTDLPFAQHDWPLGDAATRAKVFEEHKWWTKAMLYYLSNDEELRSIQPALVEEMSSYGLCADEYPDSKDRWTPQLYVRESIRLRGPRVLTQADVCSPKREPSAVGLSQWQPDVHAVKRLAAQIDGRWRVVNAGGRDSGKMHEGCKGVVEVPYEALTPRKDDTANLLVPVCASMTHIAFASYRLEPQYAIFGHASGTAAALVVKAGTAVQALNVTGLQEVLVKQGQKVFIGPAPSPPPSLMGHLQVTPFVTI